MPTAMLERVDTDVETESDEGDDYDHILCHCNKDIAWCGVELQGFFEASDLSGQDCPECSALLLQHQTECPHGCDCTHSMRLLYCGIDDMPREEPND